LFRGVEGALASERFELSSAIGYCFRIIFNFGHISSRYRLTMTFIRLKRLSK
jgi:hypothetical protein